MFTSKTPYTNTPLTEVEQSQLKDFEFAMRSQDNNKINMAITILLRWPQASVLKFSRNSETFYTFLESNQDLHRAWSEMLRKKRYPAVEITSKDQNDKKISYSVFHHYLSHYYMTLFAEPEQKPQTGIRLLNRSCELGSYYALGKRCKINYEILKINYDNLTEEKRDNMAAKIIEDTVQLTNLYGSIGYARSGLILLKLSHIFKTYTLRGSSIFETAIKNFLCASLLRDDSYSNDLIANLTKEKGVLSILKAEGLHLDNANSWDDMINVLQKWVAKDIYNQLYQQAKNEIASREQREEKTLSVKI